MLKTSYNGFGVFAIAVAVGRKERHFCVKLFFIIDDKEDLISLLEEAAALKHVIKKDILRTLVGEEGAKNEDVFVSLLADLHQEQIDDGLRWFDDVKQV